MARLSPPFSHCVSSLSGAGYGPFFARTPPDLPSPRVVFLQQVPGAMRGTFMMAASAERTLGPQNCGEWNRLTLELQKIGVAAMTMSSVPLLRPSSAHPYKRDKEELQENLVNILGLIGVTGPTLLHGMTTLVYLSRAVACTFGLWLPRWCVHASPCSS